MIEPGKRRFVCMLCMYVYDEAEGDPDSGIAPGTRWEDIPDDWRCPKCGASKTWFEDESRFEQRQAHYGDDARPGAPAEEGAAENPPDAGGEEERA